MEIIKAAIIIGIPVLDNMADNSSPIPPARNTPPNIPPAPVTKIMEQIGPSALLQRLSICSWLRSPRNKAMAINNVINKAMGVLPIKRKLCTHKAEPSMTFATLSVFKPVSNKIKKIGKTKINNTRPNGGGF